MTRSDFTRGAAALGSVVALAVGAGCASFQQPMSERGAGREAVGTVCGVARGADSACAVRSVERAGRGYRVLVDHRPPVAGDPVLVLVRPSGRLGGWSVAAQPPDSARPAAGAPR